MGEKTRTAAKFGSRYGVGIRRSWLKVEDKQRQKHSCPFCGFKKVKRVSRGIFSCKKCGKRFSGGAFLPETLTGSIVKKMVSQKSFLSSVSELVESTEKTKGLIEEDAEKKFQEPVEKNQKRKEKHSEKKSKKVKGSEEGEK